MERGDGYQIFECWRHSGDGYPNTKKGEPGNERPSEIVSKANGDLTYGQQTSTIQPILYHSISF